ncbi:hypothetical protein ASG47_18370 [Devosia sp. Leaf420]|nr:hypothetical protein ASG47_18370 [Devosia sp. Leaf420]
MFSRRVAGGASTSLFEQALINFQEIKQFLLFNQVPHTFEAPLAGMVISIVSLTAFTTRYTVSAKEIPSDLRCATEVLAPWF